MKPATLLRLLRAKQYVKNAFVFGALLFTRGYVEPTKVGLALAAFAAMCLLASGTYIVNDLFDLERDRAHPRKRSRPLASGAVSPGLAKGIAGACLVAGLTVAWAVNPSVFGFGVGYLTLQAAYNARLKHVPIVDVFTIASGFVIRVIVGALAIQAQVSGWILLCTASLALLIGFGKRRHEFVTQGDARVASRESLAGYTLPALDAFVVAAAAGSAMCYGVYAVESRTAHQYPALILTVPFVVFAICRYTLLIFGDGDTGEPESVVARDRPLIASFALFAAFALLALTGFRIDFLQ